MKPEIAGRSFRRIHLVIVLTLLSALFSTGYLILCGFETVLETKSRRFKVGDSDVLDMWFRDDGYLVVLQRKASGFSVSLWSPLALVEEEPQPEPMLIDLSSEYSRQESAVRPGVKHSKSASQILADQLAAIELGEFPFAVSADGLTFAWAWDREIRVRLLGGSSAGSTLTLHLREQDRVKSLGFLEDGVIVALGDGKLKGYEFGSGEPPHYNPDFDQSWSIWARGPKGSRLVAYSTPDPDSVPSLTEVVAMKSLGAAKLGMEQFGVNDNTTAFAISSRGEVFIGTDKGKIWLWPDVGGKDFDYLPERAAVRALSIQGNNLVVGGAFSGIYVAKGLDLRSCRKILDSPGDVDLLALSDSRMAYATPDGAEVVEVGYGYALRRGGDITLTLFSIFISVVALLHAILIDWENLRQRKPLVKEFEISEGTVSRSKKRR
jgi:hypothetical protein